MSRIDTRLQATERMARRPAEADSEEAPASGLSPDRLKLSVVDSEAEAPSARARGFAARLVDRVKDFAAQLPGLAGEALGSVFKQGYRWIVGPFKDEIRSREVLEDPAVFRGDAAAAAEANAALQAGRAAEEAALSRLGPRAAAYRQLRERCKDNPPARLALQTMLVDGRLTASKDLRGSQGEDLLSHLDRLATQPLAEGVDRQALLPSLIEELENPTKLAQEQRGTCVATTATIFLTRQSPAEYARLVSELAAPSGKATLANGATVQRKADWSDAEDGNRTVSMRLLQPVLMEYGNLVARYDNDVDKHKLRLSDVIRPLARLTGGKDPELTLGGGLESFGTDRMLQALTGKSFDTIFWVTRFNRDGALRDLASTLAKGRQVSVGLIWANNGSSGHEVLVEKMDKEWVYYTNPWGQKERMRREDFDANLSSVHLPES